MITPTFNTTVLKSATEAATRLVKDGLLDSKTDAELIKEPGTKKLNTLKSSLQRQLDDVDCMLNAARLQALLERLHQVTTLLYRGPKEKQVKFTLDGGKIRVVDVLDDKSGHIRFAPEEWGCKLYLDDSPTAYVTIQLGVFDDSDPVQTAGMVNATVKIGERKPKATKTAPPSEPPKVEPLLYIGTDSKLELAVKAFNAAVAGNSPAEAATQLSVILLSRRNEPALVRLEEDAAKNFAHAFPGAPTTGIFSTLLTALVSATEGEDKNQERANEICDAMQLVPDETEGGATIKSTAKKILADAFKTTKPGGANGGGNPASPSVPPDVPAGSLLIGAAGAGPLPTFFQKVAVFEDAISEPVPDRDKVERALIAVEEHETNDPDAADVKAKLRQQFAETFTNQPGAKEFLDEHIGPADGTNGANSHPGKGAADLVPEGVEERPAHE